MSSRTGMIGSLLVGMLVFAALAGAAPGSPPGQNKLPAPTNLTCSIVDGVVQVSWDLVAGANAYQVEHIGILADGTMVTDSEFVTSPPVGIEVNDFASLTIHVRALPAPKHEGQPLQAGAPKGDWSEPCVVALPASF